MALSQEQWLRKLKDLIPDWVFEREDLNESVFDGLAKILSTGQTQYEEHLRQTFIDTADEEFLNIHAEERNIVRNPVESIAVYRETIKNIVNNSNCPSLKDLVDKLLIVGESKIIENANAQNFLSRDAYLNRKVYDTGVQYNAFTVILEPQLPDPVTFLTRDNFLDRDDTLGSNKSIESIFESIVNIINKNRAFGTVYRLIERGN